MNAKKGNGKLNGDVRRGSKEGRFVSLRVLRFLEESPIEIARAVVLYLEKTVQVAASGRNLDHKKWEVKRMTARHPTKKNIHANTTIPQVRQKSTARTRIQDALTCWALGPCIHNAASEVYLKPYQSLPETRQEQ